MILKELKIFFPFPLPLNLSALPYFLKILKIILLGEPQLFLLAPRSVFTPLKRASKRRQNKGRRCIGLCPAKGNTPRAAHLRLRPSRREPTVSGREAVSPLRAVSAWPESFDLRPPEYIPSHPFTNQGRYRQVAPLVFSPKSNHARDFPRTFLLLHMGEIEIE